MFVSSYTARDAWYLDNFASIDDLTADFALFERLASMVEHDNNDVDKMIARLEEPDGVGSAMDEARNFLLRRRKENSRILHAISERQQSLTEEIYHQCKLMDVPTPPED